MQSERSQIFDLLAVDRQADTPRLANTDAELCVENDRLREEISKMRLRILELERLADMDPFLSVYNRRAFMREIERAQSVSERFGLASSIIFFDLDGFKSVNDTHGHGLGDEVLKAFSNALTTGVRACDMVARLGGDEFGVLLFKSDAQVASAKAAALTCRIGRIQIKAPTGLIRISASWGVANCGDEETPQDILDHADRQMYINKRADYSNTLDPAAIDAII